MVLALIRLGIEADQGSRDSVCQGKGKLGGGKSCDVLYCSARSSRREVHGPSTKATI